MVLTVSFVVSPESRACCLRRLRNSPQTWYQRRGIRTPRLRRPRDAPSSEAQPASIASRALRSWRSRNAPR